VGPFSKEVFMAWSTPKTDWSASNGVAAADFNRIEGNTAYIGKPETGTFDITFPDTQFAVATTVTVKWIKRPCTFANDMDIVHLFVPYFQGTSIANTFYCASTAIPTDLFPPNEDYYIPVVALNNGAREFAFVQITPGSFYVYDHTGTGTGWATSGLKGLYGSTLTYQVHHTV
jgi:hypothetical protein